MAECRALFVFFREIFVARVSMVGTVGVFIVMIIGDAFCVPPQKEAIDGTTTATDTSSDAVPIIKKKKNGAERKPSIYTAGRERER